ncbi:MAG: GNAT family N-acetyltransferase [Hyphomonadaceae bacterium]|nr:GNAT family N-acetyltransferase [Hyphomonadaceae bacterium]
MAIDDAAPILRDARVWLRACTPDDAAALFAAHGDEAAHRFWSSPALRSVEETHAYIKETLAMACGRVWAVTEDGGEALGRIGLFHVRQGVAEIGLILRRSAQGRGLMGAAVRLVCAHAFAQLGYHRIVADIDPENAASIALFERCGFQREGLLRANWITHLGMRDTALYALVRDDAAPRSGAP